MIFVFEQYFKHRFPGLEKIKQHYSQSFQELFVLSMLNGKTGGFYLEIGAGQPIGVNNTLILETLFDYKGISIGNNMLEQACFGLVGFCQSMEKAGILGYNFFPEKTANEMLVKILNQYLEITRKQENHPKFEKAETKKAIYSAIKFKEDIKIGQEIVTRILS